MNATSSRYSRYGQGKRLPSSLGVSEYQPDFQKQFNKSMKQLEKMYWDYLDNYCARYPHVYPKMRMVDFMAKLFLERRIDATMVEITGYVKRYNKYKKSLPTAGVIMYYQDPKNSHIYFPVVKMTGIRIFSMPKGKQENNTEPITLTAIREFHEETGINLDGLINNETQCVSIAKTKFFLVETDHMEDVNSYSSNEIARVKWVDAITVLNNADNYSNQAVFTAQWLLTNLG